MQNAVRDLLKLFHIEKRAETLFDALDGKAYTSDEAGRPR